MSTTTILFLGAIPDGQRRLRLDREVRAISEALRDVPGARLETVWASTFEDLLAGALRHQPTIVHFSGHARPDALIFEGEDGGPAPASLDALRRLFGALPRTVRLVVLNACDSLPIARALLPFTGCALGTTEPIGDVGAIAFSGAFYRGLAAGLSVAQAADLGRAALVAARIEGADDVRVEHRRDVKPSALRLLTPPPTALDRLLAAGARPMPAHATPAQHLDARFEAVPFGGRAAVLAELDRWADDDARVSVRLLHGPGGAGKTRLAIAWIRARRARAADPAGFVEGPLDADALDTLLAARRLDVVVDAAETRPDLPALLARLAADPPPAERVRVLLLARGMGDWWSLLAQDPAIGALLADGPPALELAGLTTRPERAAEFRRAAEAFRALRGWPAAPSAPEDLRDARFGRPLYLHMAALLAGEGRGVDADALLGGLLDHEARSWLARVGLRGAEMTDAAVELRWALDAVLAAVTLRGGALDIEHLRALVRPHAKGEIRKKIMALLPKLYRSPAWLVAPLQPDLLGEALVLRVLRDGQLHPGWLGRATAGADDRELTAAFTALGRAEVQDAATAGAAEEALLAAEPLARVEPAFEALRALATRTSDARLGLFLAATLIRHGTPALAAALEPRLPAQTVNLREVAAWVQATLVESAPSPADRARYLNNLAVRLLGLGHADAAVDAAEAAAEGLRGLAGVPEWARDAALATVLDTLASALAGVGERGRARAVAAEAVERARRGDDAAALARVLSNQSVQEAALDRHEEAHRLAAEALTLLRRAPAGQGEERARVLTNLGLWTLDLGHPIEALALLEEAVAVRRALAAERPDAFEPSLAASLANVAICQQKLGNPEAALAATDEAIEVRRRLAATRPAVFEPELAGALNNRAGWLTGLGRRPEALRAVEEAVAIRRRLAQAQPGTHGPDLGGSLSNLGLLRAASGDRSGALVASEEAVAVFRALAATDPAAFGGALAQVLDVLGALQAGVGQAEAALATAQEAVAAYRALAAARPEARTPDLARSLMNLGLRLRAVGRQDEALAAAAEAVALRRTLARALPAAHEADLARSLMTLGIGLSDAGRREEALAATDEALAIFERLARALPAAHEPDLAGCHTNRGVCLALLGRGAEAREATAAAVGVYRRLFAAEPGAFAPELARALANLAARALDAGDPAAARAAAGEAVGLYQALAQALPGPFDADLAEARATLGRAEGDAG